MNEPPIASPFGSYDSTFRPPRNAPQALKVLVGLQIFYTALSAVIALIGASFYPTSARAMIPNIIGIAVSCSLFEILYFGLLKGWKSCWWLFQLLMIWTVYLTIRHFVTGHYYREPLILPAPIRWIFFVLQIALEIYLLTPAIHDFFFPKPGTT